MSRGSSWIEWHETHTLKRRGQYLRAEGVLHRSVERKHKEPSILDNALLVPGSTAGRWTRSSSMRHSTLSAPGFIISSRAKYLGVKCRPLDYGRASHGSGMTSMTILRLLCSPVHQVLARLCVFFFWRSTRSCRTLSHQKGDEALRSTCSHAQTGKRWRRGRGTTAAKRTRQGRRRSCSAEWFADSAQGALGETPESVYARHHLQPYPPRWVAHT